MTGQAVIDVGPAGAGLLYDSRRGVYYAKPLLRGWLHLLFFFVSLTGGALLLAGGLLYIVGALSYHRRWPDPYPSVLGYHEVFHVYVCAAAVCQYAAIARFAG